MFVLRCRRHGLVTLAQCLVAQRGSRRHYKMALCASVWRSASGSGTELRSGAYSAAQTGEQRCAADPQTEALRSGRSEIPVRDERERNAANRPPPEGGGAGGGAWRERKGPLVPAG